jgi:hypothetical protein
MRAFPRHPALSCASPTCRCHPPCHRSAVPRHHCPLPQTTYKRTSSCSNQYGLQSTHLASTTPCALPAALEHHWPPPWCHPNVGRPTVRLAPIELRGYKGIPSSSCPPTSPTKILCNGKLSPLPYFSLKQSPSPDQLTSSPLPCAGPRESPHLGGARRPDGPIS